VQLDRAGVRQHLDPATDVLPDLVGGRRDGLLDRHRDSGQSGRLDADATVVIEIRQVDRHRVPVPARIRMPRCRSRSSRMRMTRRSITSPPSSTVSGIVISCGAGAVDIEVTALPAIIAALSIGTTTARCQRAATSRMDSDRARGALRAMNASPPVSGSRNPNRVLPPGGNIWLVFILMSPCRAINTLPYREAMLPPITPLAEGE